MQRREEERSLKIEKRIEIRYGLGALIRTENTKKVFHNVQNREILTI